MEFEWSEDKTKAIRKKNGVSFYNAQYVFADSNRIVAEDLKHSQHENAVAVSTNTRSVARDMRYYVEQTNAVCVITQPAFANMIFETCPDIGFLVVTDNNAGEAATVPSERDSVFFAELLAGEMNRLPRRPTEAMANLSVQFTSGTTARPKAVLWTHAQWYLVRENQCESYAFAA